MALTRKNTYKKDAIARTHIETRKNWKINPNVVLTYISKNPDYLPNLEEYTVEEEVFRVRLVLWHTRTTFERYSKMAKEQSVRKISEETLVKLLTESQQKKYKERDSPAFSANLLCGGRLVGNDGKMYESVRNKGGVCTWSAV
jgi:hypothetical protein